MNEDYLELIGKAAKMVQKALDLLPCRRKDTCCCDACELYEACCSLVEGRDKLEWILLD